jgi:hypothetical protein
LTCHWAIARSLVKLIGGLKSTFVTSKTGIVGKFIS